MADKEIRIGDIVSGDIPNPDARWRIDGSGNLVLTTPNGQYQLDTVLTLLDQATDPSANGEFTLNGSDVKVHSGGSVRNLSNVGADTRTDVSDGGALVVADTTDINFGTDLSVTDDTDGTVTVDSTASGSGADDSRVQMFARRGVSA